MNKAQFETHVETWLLDFCTTQKDFNFLKLYKGINLAKANDEELHKIPIIPACDFICDFSILIELKDGKKDLILVNRYAKSVGLRSIGEMLVYCKIATPFLAFIISSKGHSSEINNILVNDKISKDLFCYNDKFIQMFCLGKNIEKNSILPLFGRNALEERAAVV